MKKFLTAAVVAASISSMTAQSQQSIDNPMTQAMLDVYAKELEANPKDADIYFRRANEYYKFNQYLSRFVACQGFRRAARRSYQRGKRCEQRFGVYGDTSGATYRGNYF